MKKYVPTIGIEVHAELKTATKMFCGSKNAPHEAEPNTHVCPVCMAHPGTLPTINKEAVSHVLKVGMALGGSLASFSEFDRKNYFYPDIPKSYQISQYKYPLVSGGELAGIAITRVHLEEDTARSLHDEMEGSLVDYNRAGVPLMELVTEPVIHDAASASAFARELQLLLRTLGVSDANMEKGEMRVEANISISSTDTLGTKVEVKNLNSFRSVEAAINYELERQAELLDNRQKVLQETRGWDELKNSTYSQRTKETAEDYRYFPDPDLPKLDVSLMPLSRLREELPELPAQKRLKYDNLGLTREQIEILISDMGTCAFYDAAVNAGLEQGSARLAANYLISDIQSLLAADRSKSLSDASVGAFVTLMRMVDAREITSRVAKDLLADVLFNGVDPRRAVEERGLASESSSDALVPIVHAVIAENESVATEYRNGKVAVIQYLVGQGMKKTKGAADPELLRTLIETELRSAE